ncbi:DUF397 domain-containing protein [Streptomyces vilmorinianum]|uniref:DUF397 domain-containing protein n=1 Tax=Streptomyces vilmorinianum TaxID=3051092 RepID=UPI0010FAE0BD|nr:DUF397 domain-containing protein [Streptomyces vilmorinianum]
MPTYQWRKSSYSPDGSNCVCVALAPDGTVRLRDSKAPERLVAVGGGALRVFVEAVRGSGMQSCSGW